MVCTETGQPIYMVANQAALKEISHYLPLNKKDLMQIVGFGKAKAEKYGDEILEAVESYCSRYGLESNMSAKKITVKKERNPKSDEIKSDTKKITFNLYKEGKDIAAIAIERKLANSTIEGHLVWYIANDEIDINELVSSEKQKLVLGAAAEHGTESHKKLIETLQGEVSYGELKMVLAANKALLK